MPDQHVVRVDLGRCAYSINIEPGSIAYWGERLRSEGISGRLFVVSNPTVDGLHGGALRQGLEREFPDTRVILIPDGEEYKSLATVHDVVSDLIRLGATRKDTIAAFGGGVVGDLAGFAAATYLRGVRLVFLPTTLLAQTDSSVGGKVGVNHELGKNLIGAFHQPAAVLIDPLLLRTLPERELKAGLFEVIKHAFIRSSELLSKSEVLAAGLPAFDPNAMTDIIRANCAIKAAVVESDEREAGPRMVLNFGHTIGHALEVEGKYSRLLHGEAVGWGILAALWLSRRMGLVDGAPVERYDRLLSRLAPPDLSGFDSDSIMQAVERDKKNFPQGLHLVLLGGIGSPVIRSDVPRALLREAVDYLLARGSSAAN